jgi:hypothetical protein
MVIPEPFHNLFATIFNFDIILFATALEKLMKGIVDFAHNENHCGGVSSKMYTSTRFNSNFVLYSSLC